MPQYDNSTSSEWGFTTRQIHAGQPVDSETSARNLPIYSTTAYVFDSAEHAAQRFSLADPGPIYSRLTNPTLDAVERRLSSLEGGVAAVLLSSGMAAINLTVLTLMGSGGHIVTSPRLYGGTDTLFRHTLPKLGITTTFVDDPDDLASWEAAIRPETRLLFGETISNPLNDVLDIPSLSELAHGRGLPLVVDNTVATPYLVRPLELGADIVIESASKFLSGNGSIVAGALIDGGRFDWGVQRNGQDLFPGFTTPDESYHGLVYKDLGAPAFALKVRAGLLRDTGPTLSPMNAWILNNGLDTLSLRLDRHVSNARAVAEFLDGHDGVDHVAYAGLPSSPWHALAERIAPRGVGSVLSFSLRIPEGEDARTVAWRFIDALRLHSNLANIGDVRSLVAHPASTTHSQGSVEANAIAGVTEATVRLSVGIEDIDDIIADLELGFAAL